MPIQYDDPFLAIAVGLVDRVPSDAPARALTCIRRPSPSRFRAPARQP